MKYLFFDIEASEGRSICSFGYVLTDENFVILKKEDILINPEARFCTQSISKKKQEVGKGITLAYSEKTFKNSPSFPQRYELIRSILENESVTIIGFSHSNDVRYLCTACHRYELPFFSYKFFDIQDVYREYSKNFEQISLERIINELGVNIDGYTLHKSDDDAEISMLIAKTICQKSNVSLNQLIAQYSRYIGETKDGEIKYNGIESEKTSIKKARNACRGAVNNFANNMKVPFVKDSIINGMKICTSSRFEKDNWIFAIKLVGVLSTYGARYVGNIHEADYYIVFDEKEGEKGDRLYFIQKNMQSLKIKVLQKNELFSSIGICEKDIWNYSSPKVEKVIYQTERYKQKVLRNINPMFLSNENKF